MKHFILALLLVISYTLNAQFGNRNQNNEWDASWVYVPESGETDSGLYLFRKTLNLESVPGKFVVRVTADNRYKLYVNEKLVSVGPALGDLKHWNYETVDLAQYLNSGDNIVAALVWNEGSMKPVSQFSYRTGFLVQGTDDVSKALNTNDSWKCIEDKSYTPKRQSVRGYYAAGAGDFIDMHSKIKGWEMMSFNDSSWKPAQSVFEAETRGFGFRQRAGWQLIPSIVPQMELKEERFAELRSADNVSVPKGFPMQKSAVKIPKETAAKILLDQSYLTNAYLTLIFSGGENSYINITYAEGLYDEEGVKGNRNEIEGKTISGRQDSIISDGSAGQNFTSLSYRTYRYVELQVVTKDEPLTIDDVYGTFTGYPFELSVKLESDLSELDKMLEIGWRTARLCAVETYMDCPYYERLQYVGDTRIQHFVSYYNSGDDRLAKNALNLIDNSRQPDGYTLSRYPDTQNQVIPTYSLWQISMLYDYMMYGKDPDFVKDKLLGARQILNYFITFIDDDGSLKNVPGWNFTDWVPVWRFGTAPASEDGSSANIDLQLLHAFQSAIELEKYAGSQDFVNLYTSMANKLSKTIKEKYWDDSKNIFADTPEKDVYSQHANSLAILAGLVDDSQAEHIGEVMLNDTSMAPASIYFKYYLHLALSKAGQGDDYLDWLDIWRKNIELGMSTWGETSQVESTRSDCHAWGASPNIEFFRIILGIESDAPNFKSIKIEPHLGDIEKISGEMPHPSGKISVNYDNSGSKLKAEITLPENADGTFIWNNQEHALKGGVNNLNL